MRYAICSTVLLLAVGCGGSSNIGSNLGANNAPANATPNTPPKKLSAEDIKKFRGTGEQLLNSLKDIARVQYAKTDEHPATMEPYLLEGTMSGTHFQIVDKVWLNEDKTRGGLCIHSIEDNGLGWAVMFFEWASGESMITWHSTNAAAQAALHAFSS